MSKTKNKNRSEIEVLRGQNRSLLKEIKQLRKQLRIQEDKDEDIQLELEGYAVYQPEAQIKKVICIKCKEGEFKRVIELLDRDLYNCTVCDYKKTIKK
jgi:hypothetical protein